MANFGGLGGIMQGREFDPEDKFEAMISRVFGSRMKTDDGLCKQIWGALANVDWYKPESHDSASYSLRGEFAWINPIPEEVNQDVRSER